MQLPFAVVAVAVAVAAAVVAAAGAAVVAAAEGIVHTEMCLLCQLFHVCLKLVNIGFGSITQPGSNTLRIRLSQQMILRMT